VEQGPLPPELPRELSLRALLPWPWLPELLPVEP
jgi:hypothetical protein